MPGIKCYPRTDPNAQWNYCPSYGLAIAFACFFGFTTVAHILQAVLHKKGYAWVLIMGAVWETAGYIFRSLSTLHQLNEAFATAQQLLILLAPLWINAFVYMTLGRMIHFFIPDDKTFGIKAKRITLSFVLCDVSAFVVQATGGVMTTPSSSPSTQQLGLHIYMGGVGINLFFNCFFIALCIRTHLKLAREQQNGGISMEAANSPMHAKHLLYLLYVVLTLIVYRNIYRLIEFSAGVDSTITLHEWYTYVFDSTPMLLALIVVNTYHPGRILRGPKSDFSDLKAEKKAKKATKKAEKAAKKEEKRELKMQKQKGKDQKIVGKLLAQQEKKSGGVMNSGGQGSMLDMPLMAARTPSPLPEQGPPKYGHEAYRNV